MMKGSCVSLLLLMLPGLLSATGFRFNWNRHGQSHGQRPGQPDDTALRFKPLANRQHGIVTRSQAEQSGEWPPAFCNKLDCPKFTVIDRQKDYELRQYDPSRWVSTTSVGIDYDKASYKDFMRLFHYIGGNNTRKEEIDMTAPVLNSIIPGQGPACEDNFTMSFFMSTKVKNPPQPSDPAVFLNRLPMMRFYVRSFGGFATKDRWLEEAVKLEKDLEGKGTYLKQFFYTAGYNSPFQIFDRHNEVWFIAQ